jgi:hypothetical protein
MKKIFLLPAFFLLSFALQAQWLHVSRDGRRLVKEDGSAFFYLGDTAWELFHRCSRQETEMYLKDRKAKGFTVIQAVVLAELDGLNTPNAEGHRPLIDNNPLHPGEAYFKDVDRVIRKAEELGLYIALLPTWGDKWNLKWGEGPVIFDTPEKAEKYGKWLGKRYKDQPNIIWVLGGDRNPEKPLHLEIIRAMARGLEEGDGGRHLMTYHPQGGHSSSQWFQQDAWLDFNMAQTGHAELNNPVYRMVGHDYSLTPVKPCLDGEPQYEDIPVGFSALNQRFTAFDVRQAAYWSVLAGALGHTYGNGNIWQMYAPGRTPVLAAATPWYLAIHMPGARQMGYMRKLFLSRPFLQMIPGQEVLARVFGQDTKNIRAARGADSSFVIVYTPYGNPVHIRMEMLDAGTVSGYWYNPREGNSIPIEPFKNPGKTKAFVPPSGGPLTDWVLVLDDPDKNYPDPAKEPLK